MFVHLVLFSCLAVMSTASSETDELGKGIDLRKTNLFGDFKEKQASIFEPLPSACFEKVDITKSKKLFENYASNQEFYKKLTREAGLSASFQSFFSLGFSLVAATNNTALKESKVRGTSLIVFALKKKILAKKDCLNDDQNSNLKRRFLEDLEELPLKMEKPWLKSSWRPYRDFLKKYGSHVVTAVEHGTSFRQMIFAESSSLYSWRDFQVKACASLAGPIKSIGKLGLSACTNVSESELSKVSKMVFTAQRFAVGGKMETSNKLLTQDVSKELLEQFMNEAKDSTSPVRHKLVAIWDILQARFKRGHPNKVRGINLEYYYLGFLNYGCHYLESGGIDLQKFDYTDESTSEYPDLRCSLASEGCHSNKDCHHRGFWCSCRGPSCVMYESVEQDTGKIKCTAKARIESYKRWKGCDWEGPFLFSKCKCKNSRRALRREVWSLPSKDAAKRPNSTKRANSTGVQRQPSAIKIKYANKY